MQMAIKMHADNDSLPHVTVVSVLTVSLPSAAGTE